MNNLVYLSANHLIRILGGAAGISYGFSVLPAEVIGQVFYFAAIATIGASLISFGLDQKLLVMFSSSITGRTLFQSIFIRSTILLILILIYYFFETMHLIRDPSHYLLVILLLYVPEILNGSREFLIANNKYKDLFLLQFLSSFLLFGVCILLHTNGLEDFVFLCLCFGGKFFFNMAIFVRSFLIVRSETQKFDNFFVLEDYRNLLIGGALLLTTALTLQFNSFIALHFIKQNSGDVDLANFGMAQRIYFYIQIPFNLYIVTKTKALVQFYGSKGFFSTKETIKSFWKMFAAIISVSLTSAFLYSSELLNKFHILEQYRDIPLIFMIFSFGLAPYAFLNILSKYVLSYSKSVFLLYRAVFVIVFSAVTFFVFVGSLHVWHFALVLLIAETLGCLLVLCFVTRSRSFTR